MLTEEFHVSWDLETSCSSSLVPILFLFLSNFWQLALCCTTLISWRQEGNSYEMTYLQNRTPLESCLTWHDILPLGFFSHLILCHKIRKRSWITKYKWLRFSPLPLFVTFILSGTFRDSSPSIQTILQTCEKKLCLFNVHFSWAWNLSTKRFAYNDS